MCPLKWNDIVLFFIISDLKVDGPITSVKIGDKSAMKDLQLLLGAYLLDSTITQVILVHLVVIELILFVQFSCHVNFKRSVHRHLFVSVQIHPKGIFTLVVRVVEADVYVGNVADLKLRQHTEDPLFKQLLDLAATVLKLLLVILVGLWGK